MAFDTASGPGSSSGGAGLFDVYLPDLYDGSTDLASDAHDAAGEAADASTWIATASSAAGADPLAGALTRLADELTSRGTTLVDDLDAASTRLTSNADTYLRHDGEVAGLFDAWNPGAAETYTAPTGVAGSGVGAAPPAGVGLEAFGAPGGPHLLSPQ